MDYTFFPSEVWMVERLMHFFFTTDKPLKSYVYDEAKLAQKIDEIKDKSNWMPRRSIKDRLLKHPNQVLFH
jgi:hypothetical protein